MQARGANNGDIVVPGELAEKLGFLPGEPLYATMDAGRIVLVQQPKPKYAGAIVDDPITELPVIDFGPGAPVLTHAKVPGMLANFP